MGFLSALGVPAQEIPDDLDAQLGKYRTLLSKKRVLILLDNARDSDQVRPLLPGASGCLVLVTSRHQLTALAATVGARLFSLEILTREEAHELLAARLGMERVLAEPDAVEQILTRCARLPLALAVAAARAAAQPTFTLTELARQLGSLNAMRGGDSATDVRAVFSWSYSLLTPPAARLFRLLGLHRGPETSVEAAASLAAVPPEEARTLLSELASNHLLTESLPGRFACHDLLRAYASDLVRTTESDQERDAATHRLLDHFVHTAYNADRLLYPSRDSIRLAAPVPGVTLTNLVDVDQALAWFSAEQMVLLTAVDQVSGYDTHVWQLAWALTTFLDRHGHWHDWIAVERAAVAATRRLADPAIQGNAHKRLAHAHTRLGTIDDARAHLQCALELFREAGDLVGQAYTYRTLTNVAERQGRYVDALNYARQAHDLHQAGDNKRGQASALNGIGWYYALLGEHQQALVHCQQALGMLQQLGDRDAEAATWDSLGYVHHQLGDHTQAATCYSQALRLLRAFGGHRFAEADVLNHLGDTYQSSHRIEDAARAWQQALVILEELDHPDAASVRRKLAV